ncbi:MULTISPECIES: hypothetical protein [Bradyrhizobium]|uniref:hypothetical protein n=1 Tax=Bradyrhizobium elkanii TaxID=29448 RepID=UPI000403A3C3|nr:hypothetical protein [Bradyrhizobium elkanii]
MIYIYGLLSSLFEFQQTMHGRAWHSDAAQQRWLEATREPENKVVYVDFKAIREAKEGT